MGTLLGNVFSFPKVPMQRSYNWDFVLPSFGYLVDGIAVSKFCQSCNFGQYNLSDSELYRVGAYQQFYPGTMNIGSVTAVFITPIPDIISLYFAQWKKRIVDENGFYSPSNVYKKNIYVILYDRTGIPANFIQLNKAFPIKFPSYDLDYEGEKMVRFDVEFKVDRIYMGTGALSQMGTVGKIASKAVKGALSVIGF